MSENAGETGQNPNQAFFEKAERSLRELFDRAQAAHELHFAMSLMPEFRVSRMPVGALLANRCGPTTSLPNS
jgi:hypothetical protein